MTYSDCSSCGLCCCAECEPEAQHFCPECGPAVPIRRVESVIVSHLEEGLEDYQSSDVWGPIQEAFDVLRNGCKTCGKDNCDGTPLSHRKVPET